MVSLYEIIQSAISHPSTDRCWQKRIMVSWRRINRVNQANVLIIVGSCLIPFLPNLKYPMCIFVFSGVKPTKTDTKKSQKPAERVDDGVGAVIGKGYSDDAVETPPKQSTGSKKPAKKNKPGEIASWHEFSGTCCYCTVCASSNELTSINLWLNPLFIQVSKNQT